MSRHSPSPAGPSTPSGRRLREVWVRLASAHRGAAYHPPPFLDGGRDLKTNRVYKPVWDALAARAEANKVDPAAMVLYLFRRTMPSEGLPDHRLVGNADLARQFQAEADISADRVVAELERNRQVFVAARDRAGRLYPHAEDALAAAVADQTVCPLYRFVVAVTVNLPVAVARLRGPAVAQFLRAPDAYRRSWASVLTPAVFAALDPNGVLP